MCEKLIRTDSWMMSWKDGKYNMVRTPLGEERHKVREEMKVVKERCNSVGIGPGEDISVGFWN